MGFHVVFNKSSIQVDTGNINNRFCWPQNLTKTCSLLYANFRWFYILFEMNSVLNIFKSIFRVFCIIALQNGRDYVIGGIIGYLIVFWKEHTQLRGVNELEIRN